VRYSKKRISYIQTDRELSNFVQSITNYSQFRGQESRQQNTTKQMSEPHLLSSDADLAQKKRMATRRSKALDRRGSCSTRARRRTRPRWRPQRPPPRRSSAATAASRRLERVPARGMLGAVDPHPHQHPPPLPPSGVRVRGWGTNGRE